MFRRRDCWWLEFAVFVVIAAAVGALLAMSGTPAWADDAPSPARKIPKRNIVLFVADDLGKDLGCYGNTSIRTPAIDKFAADATLFTHAFATTASCSASRSVILTGLYNHANAHYGHEHSYHHFAAYPWVQSLPVMLSRGGYRTARAGKYHVAPEAVFKFEEVVPGNSRDMVQMVDNARDFIRADSERPFFLYICTSDPHRGGGTADHLPFKPNLFGNKLNGGYTGIDEVRYDASQMTVPPFLPDSPACRQELAQYAQSVSRIDQGVGYLLKELQEAGVYDETLILLISDHGIAMPGAKTTVYEPGLNSPCIVRLPGASRRGIANNALVNWADLTPTLLDYAGLLDRQTNTAKPDVAVDRSQPEARGPARRPTSFHGRSFLSVIDQEQPPGWDRTYASHTFHEIQMYYPMRVVRERQYKLIWNLAHPLPFPFASDLWAAPTWQEQWKQGPDASYGVRTVRQYIQRPVYELYDLQADPHESRNLADDPAHAQTLADLTAKLKAFQKETRDPWIMKWEYE